MGIRNNDLRAENDRDNHTELVAIARDYLLSLECESVGADRLRWPALFQRIDHVRAVLANVDAAVTKTAPEDPDLSAPETCPICNETSSPGEVDTAWQQWQCACCGSWNVYPEVQ